MSAPTPSADPQRSITVEVFEARPNKLFTEEMRQLIRFLRFSEAVLCAECGTKRKTHWTMTVPFKAHTWPKNSFALQESGTIHQPGNQVCRQHLLAPMVEETDQNGGASPLL